MSFKMDWKGSQLARNMMATKGRAMAVLKMYAVTKASQIQSYMQKNRPWTDRTGLAKATLNTRTVENEAEKKIRIILAHGVRYGIWLELSNAQKYAIIIPSLNKFQFEIARDLREIFEKVVVRM